MLNIRNLKKIVTCPDGTELTILNVDAFDVARGSQIVLAGPSGSGKTTLLHLIAGLAAPTDGEISCDGVRIDSFTLRQRDHWRAETVGYVFQKLNLLEGLSVFENVFVAGAFGGNKDRRVLEERSAALLRAVNMADKKALKPAHLSMGEQQRVAIARALVNQPKLLLADEPTASLDRRNADIVLSLLKRACEEYGCTLLLSTHDQSVREQFGACYTMSGAGRQNP